MCRYVNHLHHHLFSISYTRLFFLKTLNPKDKPIPNPKSPAMFSTEASWAKLVGHCRTAHPRSFEELERLTLAQATELKQVMTSNAFSGFMLV